MKNISRFEQPKFSDSGIFNVIVLQCNSVELLQLFDNRSIDSGGATPRWNSAASPWLSQLPHSIESISAGIVRGYWPCSWPPSQLRWRVALFKDIEPAASRSMRSSTGVRFFPVFPLLFSFFPFPSFSSRSFFRSLLLRFSSSSLPSLLMEWNGTLIFAKLRWSRTAFQV